MWNPDRTTTDALIHAIQESRAILQNLISDLVPGRRCSMEAETGAEQDPSSGTMDEGEAEEMADFEEARAPGGPPVEPRQTRKAAAERAPLTLPQEKKTRTTEQEGVGRKGCPTFASPALNHESHAAS